VIDGVLQPDLANVHARVRVNMKRDQFIESVRNFIISKSKVKTTDVGADTPLIDSGIVDSLLITELIIYVEDVLSIDIDIEDFRLASFRTIGTIYERYATEARA
jgi:acyl carrier protein